MDVDHLLVSTLYIFCHCLYFPCNSYIFCQCFYLQELHILIGCIYLFLSGLDGCHVKTTTGQQILAATGRDGNNNIYPIAFGLVDKEDKASWTWFLTQLKYALGGESGRFGNYTIISDRQKVSLQHSFQQG